MQRHKSAIQCLGRFPTFARHSAQARHVDTVRISAVRRRFVAWLDTILVQAGLPRTSEFSRVTQAIKLAKALLPVFFRQVDACVVTRRGIQTMNELNPQISRRLKVLAASPGFLPTVFGFRGDYNDPLRETIISKLSQIIDSPAGMQVQTLFQSGRLEAQPLSCLDSSFDLLATHERLLGKVRTGTASKSKASVAARGGIK